MKKLVNVISNAEVLKMTVRAWTKTNGITVRQLSQMIFGNDYRMQNIITGKLWNKKICDMINEKTWLKLAIKVDTIEV